ncbi:EAL domain-containing protein [Streptomyces sp. NPDC059104]|uniref:EAL domain-containing protein n=1 Tax=Streptomyces sp. NPDC059104 TaxID=3346729 RepID=UPI00369403DB
MSDLSNALDRDELELYYQPQVGDDGRTVAVEALIRWPRADNTVLAPDAFLGLAEHGGLMPRVTAFVLDRATARAAGWYAAGLPVPVAVNITPADALEPGFADEVLDRLSRHGLPADALKVEITETAETREMVRMAGTLAELASRGVTVSLDDFGTGHASLARLRALPVAELKVDRSFVTGMAANPEDAAVVRFSVNLAHELGLTVVAEGVEEEETRALLSGMGVGAIQGWLISPALPPALATAWLRNNGVAPRVHPERKERARCSIRER